MTDNEVRKAMKACLENAASRMGIVGYEVLQQNQPVPTSSHAVILFTVLSSRRNGWQGASWDNDTGSPLTMNENWDYLDEVRFQISAYHPRKAVDGAAKMTSVDVINAIAAFFSSPSGNALLRESGFMPLKINDVRIPVVQDDSETPQFNPNFDLTVNIHQTARVTIPTVTDIGMRGPEFMDNKLVGAVTVHRGGLYGI